MKNLLCVNTGSECEIYDVRIRDKQEYKKLLIDLIEKYSLNETKSYIAPGVNGKPIFPQNYDSENVFVKSYMSMPGFRKNTVKIKTELCYLPTIFIMIKDLFSPNIPRELSVNLINLTDLARYSASVNGAQLNLTYDENVVLKKCLKSESDEEETVPTKVNKLPTENISSKELQSIFKKLFCNLEIKKVGSIKDNYSESFVEILRSHAERNASCLPYIHWAEIALTLHDGEESIDFSDEDFIKSIASLGKYYGRSTTDDTQKLTYKN